MLKEGTISLSIINEDNVMFCLQIMFLFLKKRVNWKNILYKFSSYNNFPSQEYSIFEIVTWQLRLLPYKVFNTFLKHSLDTFNGQQSKLKQLRRQYTVNKVIKVNICPKPFAKRHTFYQWVQLLLFKRGLQKTEWKNSSNY